MKIFGYDLNIGKKFLRLDDRVINHLEKSKPVFVNIYLHGQWVKYKLIKEDEKQ